MIIDNTILGGFVEDVCWYAVSKKEYFDIFLFYVYSLDPSRLKDRRYKKATKRFDVTSRKQMMWMWITQRW